MLIGLAGSFDAQAYTELEKILHDNQILIANTENLIIDLRNNGGGSDSVWQSLIPLAYTNPIRNMGVDIRVTPLNRQMVKENYLDDPDIAKMGDAKNILQKLYNDMGAHPNQWMPMEDEPVGIMTFDKILPNPKRIGLIINHTNGSSAEEMILAFKQSMKVKLFGTSTAGVLDISNVLKTTAPSGKFKLAYCLSRSSRIPDMAIDGVGIQPDYYIDKSISPDKWVDYVNGVLNTK